MPRVYKSLVGEVFGRLTVEKFAGFSIKRSRLWVCRCKCGNYPPSPVTTNSLTSGNTTSCGCHARETTGTKRRTHGKSRTPEYVAWCAMKQRTTDPNHVSHAHYSGRGIVVCERWTNSFEMFLDDVGHKPHAAATLDRIDRTRGYEPGNVRWATRTEQCRNKSGNRQITIHGETRCVAEWAELVGIPASLIRARLADGMTAETAVFTTHTPVTRESTSHSHELRKVYSVWWMMKDRCSNPKNRSYSRYGGRGIEVCKQWVGPDGFRQFLLDMGARPTPTHSLDRVDVNGNYEPKNCRWITSTEQARNKRWHRILVVRGIPKCLSEWAAEYNIQPWLIGQRVRRGWTHERAVTTPSRH